MNLKTYSQFLGVAAVATALSVMTGCSGMSFNSTSAPVPIAGAAFQGNVHGGQQPVAGANLALYAAVTSGYAGATTNLLTRTVTTDAGGNFNVTGAYSCTAGQQLYMVATGGNPGGGNNANLALMAALGECTTLSASTFISMNEVTTVAGAFALAPFMNGKTALGTTPTNISGLAHAFASVNKLVNTATGYGPGSALPSGAIAPTAELYTLADILAGCINSTGGTAGDGTPCGMLFSLTTPAVGSAPTDTIQAVLNIAHAPTRNVAALYNMNGPVPPFNPQLTAPPADWTMAVSYKASGTFSSPKTTTVDASGNIWVANSGNSSLTVLAQSGSPVSASPFSGNGLNTPAAVAIDAGGNAWVANAGSQTVSVFTPGGSTFIGSPFAGSGTISGASSIAIDAPGNIWIANKGNNSVTELSSAGSYIRNISQNVNNPTALTIDPR